MYYLARVIVEGGWVCIDFPQAPDCKAYVVRLGCSHNTVVATAKKAITSWLASVVADGRLPEPPVEMGWWQKLGYRVLGYSFFNVYVSLGDALEVPETEVRA